MEACGIVTKYITEFYAPVILSLVLKQKAAISKLCTHSALANFLFQNFNIQINDDSANAFSHSQSLRRSPRVSRIILPNSCYISTNNFSASNPSWITAIRHSRVSSFTDNRITETKLDQFIFIFLAWHDCFLDCLLFLVHYQLCTTNRNSPSHACPSRKWAPKLTYTHSSWVGGSPITQVNWEMNGHCLSG